MFHFVTPSPPFEKWLRGPYKSLSLTNSNTHKHTHTRTLTPSTGVKLTGTWMHSNVHKDIRFIADFLLDLRLMWRTVKCQWGQFPEANYSLGLSLLYVCWELNLKTIIILLAQEFERSLRVSPCCGNGWHVSGLPELGKFKPLHISINIKSRQPT